MCEPSRRLIYLFKAMVDIQAHIETFEGVVTIEAWGETTFFYNPNRIFKRGTYFATLKAKNGEHDRASGLDREGVFRLNMGLPKPLFIEHFGLPPARPAKGGVIEGTWDFTARDTLTPHPVYGWMGWVSVLNPSIATFNHCQTLLDAAHQKAKSGFEKRLAKQ